MNDLKQECCNRCGGSLWMHITQCQDEVYKQIADKATAREKKFYAKKARVMGFAKKGINYFNSVEEELAYIKACEDIAKIIEGDV